jgi:hypothetical protein
MKTAQPMFGKLRLLVSLWRDWWSLSRSIPSAHVSLSSLRVDETTTFLPGNIPYDSTLN